MKVEWLHSYIAAWFKKLFSHSTIQPCSRGFTLIELIVAFSIITILSTVGLASFASYSRTQALNSSTLDLVNALQTAKSRAQSQVKPVDGCPILSHYDVRLCNVSGTLTCSPDVGDAEYEILTVCKNTSLPPQDIDVPPALAARSFAPNITIDSVNTTTNSFSFKLGQNGATEGSIRINGYGSAYKTITVYQDGRITVQ